MNNLDKGIKKLIINKFPKSIQKEWRIYSGFDCVVVLVDDLVFRFPKDREAKNKIKTEKILFDFLKNKLNLLIPKYKIEDKKRGFVSYRFIAGEELSFNVYSSLRKKERDRLCETLAIFLKKIHSMSFPPRISRFLLHDNWIVMFKNLKKDIKKYIYLDLKAKDKDLLDKFLKEFELMISKEKEECFVHGDFSGDNIVFDLDGANVVGVIDFGDARFSDYIIDFAHLWSFGKNMVKEVISYYADNKKKRYKIIKNSNLYFKYIIVLMLIVYKKNNNRKLFNDNWLLFKRNA